MALKKLQPKVFSEKGREELSKLTRTQEIVKGIPKSTDPVNFPVFENPVNAKALVYVPNHVVMDEDGVPRLRMDTPLVHSVTDGKRFMYYRCISGINVDGYSGFCPMCDGTADCWDLANLIIGEKCKARGLNPDDKDSKEVASIRSDAFSDRVLKDADRKFIFPIVVFDTQNDDGKTLNKDENGNIKYKVMWYIISERQYEKTWAKALEMVEGEPTHPGGHFFVLNYTYSPKNGQATKRDSANALVVGCKKMANSEQIAQQLDKQTEGWTPEKAQETVLQAIFYEESDLQEIVDEVLEPVRMRIELYNNPVESVGDNNSGFKLEKKEDTDSEEGEVPVQGLETDLDDEGDIDMQG